MIRLQVNISDGTSNALRTLAEREGVSCTEALRRLVGYGEQADLAWAAGHDVLIRRADGTVERLLRLA